MLKDIVISAMAAVIAADRLSGIMVLAPREQAGLWIGITAILIIFCIFLEEAMEKRRKRKARVQQLRQLISGLAGKGDEDARGIRQVRSAAGIHAGRGTKNRVG